MSKRIVVQGSVNVYRDGMGRETLSAIVTTKTGRYYFDRAPKCFTDLIECGHRNVVDVRYTANEDGSNPRRVEALSKPR